MENLTTSDGQDGYSILEEVKHVVAGLQFEDKHNLAPAQAYSDERACLDKILPALAEIGHILRENEEISPRRKKRLLSQLTHATDHLLHHLQSLLP